MDNYEIVYLTTYECGVCRQEVAAFLYANSNVQVSDKTRDEFRERVKQAHQPDCPGRPGPRKHSRHTRD